jgi:hypothetical protein
MDNVEQNLHRLGEGYEWPPTPPLVLRLEPRGLRRLRPLLVLLVALVVGLAVAFSVPQARSAFLRLFHLGGVSVEQVSVLPPAQERPLARGLGPIIGETRARTVLGGPLRLPDLKHPAQLHLKDGIVSVLLSSRGTVLLSEFRSRSYVLKKVASTDTDVDFLSVGGNPGLWITGKQHDLLTPAPPRLAGNVLIWETDGITYRLEGPQLTERQAVALAGQIDREP